jgi:16S rRNA (cytosine967-C5)-methyltransferase
MIGDSPPPPGSTPSEYVPGCYVFGGRLHDAGDLIDLQNIYFQDEGSQMVAAAVPASAAFLDVCAAPGGKTGLVASRCRPSILVAGDLYAERLRNLKENLVRQGVANASVVRHDAERGLPFAPASFGAVLVDAPCTGTGTIRHNPEIRYFLSPDDPAGLSRKQLAILTNASKTVGSGGALIYSTCSLEREENELVVKEFLSKNREFIKTRPSVPEQFITNEGYARTFPHSDGMDGFFIAELRRV